MEPPQGKMSTTDGNMQQFEDFDAETKRQFPNLTALIGTNVGTKEELLQRLLMRDATKNEALRMLGELKSKPCADCGHSYPSYVMDFDHVRGEKVDNISTLVSNQKWKLLSEELPKCELVCSNCHRERTHQRHVAKGEIH